jgi:DNA-directed RNA polymerase I subunit RPA2
LNIAVSAKEVYKARTAMVIEEGSIACDEDIPEQTPVDYTHMELKPTEMFSMLAALTPFSNHNQSPRNMYQCQMLKQTMGTAYHNHPYRSDNKVYKIQNPQKPIVRTEMYNTAEMDSHPQGCNAIVAVITYTGYDMEDSMIINKMSFERGFGHGIVYKTKIIEAAEEGKDVSDRKACRFTNVRLQDGALVGRYVTNVDPSTKQNTIDDDGLPVVGTLLQNDDPIAVWVNSENMPQIIKFHDDLPAYVRLSRYVMAKPFQG